MGPAAVLHLMWVTSARLVSCQGGLNLPCRGNNGGRTGQQGPAEDGCCGSGLAAQPLAARLRDDFLAEEKEVEVRV